jgi:hypothetical protein
VHVLLDLLELVNVLIIAKVIRARSFSIHRSLSFNDIPHRLDIDECATGDYWCPSNTHCDNQPGFYRCQCNEVNKTLSETVHNQSDIHTVRMFDM